MCIHYQDRLRGIQNYNAALITCSINSCPIQYAPASNAALQALSDAMEYAPIAKALSSLDASSEQRLSEMPVVPFSFGGRTSNAGD